MKKMNKGFSLVELIIVIAIMAILAGASAPALIKYINKSRVSTDIQTANTIATAIQTALANESGYDACPDTITSASLSTYWSDDDAFKKTMKSAIGGTNAPKVKSKKCIAETAAETGGDDDHNFLISVDKAANTVKVEIGGGHVAFPDASECLTNESAASCTAGDGE